MESNDAPVAVVVARPVTIVARPPVSSVLPEITPRNAILDAILIFLIAIGFHYAPAILLGESGTMSEGKLDEIAVIVKWLEAALVVVLAGYLILRNGVRPTSLGIRTQRPLVQVTWGFAGLIGGYFYMFLTFVVAMALYSLLPHAEQDLKHRMDFVSIMPVNDLWITITLLSAVALHEELLFRGMLLPLLRRACGSWWPAVLISSMIFGALHFQQGWLGMVQVSGLSIVFSLVFIQSRSLLAVMVAHFGFDFLQFQLLRVLLPFIEKWQREGALG